MLLVVVTSSKPNSVGRVSDCNAVPNEIPVLTVADAKEWSRWLKDHGEAVSSVWLVLAKKDGSPATTLTYGEALEEALCFGWVDGQLAKVDEQTFRRRFSPRRPGSVWSRRNTDLADRLIEDGRMQPPGFSAIDRAKADGSWENAYAGQGAIELPPDFALALDADADARAMFDRLSAANRYAFLYRIATAKRPETRQQRIQRFVEMLGRGETIHPQSERRAGR